MNSQLLLSAALWASMLASAIAVPPRLWTSKDGTATLTATYFKSDAEKVTLILPNGRTRVIPLAMISEADARWIAENASSSTPPDNSATESVRATAKIPAALAGKLIDDRGKPTALDTKAGVPKYYLFYYSASWCGPCHAFTPELVRFARKMKARNASLAIILSPSDRTQEDEVAYMKELRMPWPALALDQKSAPDIPRSEWGYIPAMVLVDADGKRLLQVNDTFSKEAFLAQTEKIVRDGGTPATAQN
jgi:nucleoredoxin